MIGQDKSSSGESDADNDSVPSCNNSSTENGVHSNEPDDGQDGVDGNDSVPSCINYSAEKSVHSNEPNDGQDRVDGFVQRMQSLYRSKVGNWDAHVEPYISQWLTWEAQRCKTELDTHFAYVSKQLANACLKGGIDYLDAEKVFEALSYKGGTRGTTALLLEELPCAHHFCEACKEALTVADRKGINSVHDMTFEPDKVIHSFFSNLDTGKKEIVPDQSWPVAEFSVGKVTKRHVHEGEPVFFAFKEMNQEDTDEAPQQLDPRLLSTRVYKSLMKHSADVSFATEDETNLLVPNEKIQRKIDEMNETMSEVFEGDELLSEELGLGLGYPCILPQFWAKKKNRTYLTLSKEVMKELARMFEEGQGTTNKALRYNAERAVMELSAGILVSMWDQKLICSISKIKSFFERKHQAEESENDTNRRSVSEESMVARQERGEKLLANNRRCELAILNDMTYPSLDEADIRYFHKTPVAQLRAFIKCRVLENATSTELDNMMPKKGILKEAGDGVVCAKTKTPFLIRWAFDLRNDAVKAKLVEPTQNEAQQELDQHLFTEANNSQREGFEYLDDLTNDITLETRSDVQEVGGNNLQKDEDSDDECDFESDED